MKKSILFFCLMFASVILFSRTLISHEDFEMSLSSDVKNSTSAATFVPPTISMVTPILQDSVYGNIPYEIKAKITSASGIDTAYIAYSVHTGEIDTIGMILIGTDTFAGTIPFYGFGRTISYKVIAIDAAIPSSTAVNPTSGSRKIYTKKSLGGSYILGNGPYGAYYYGPMYVTSATSTFDFSRYSYLFSASELSAAGAPAVGQITQVEWYKTSTTQTNGGANFDIYMKNSNATSLVANTLWPAIIGGATKVYNSTSTIIPANTGWIPFVVSPFGYSGQSLEITTDWDLSAVPTPSSTGGILWRFTSGFPTNVSLGANATFAPGYLGVGYGGPRRPDIRITFAAPSNLTEDVGVEAILNPNGGVLANSNINVDVLIKNYGIDTVNTMDLKWSLDGIPQTTVNWTGILPPDSTLNYNIGTLNVVVGSHSIATWTENPNGVPDMDLANDSSHFSFYACSSPLNGIYTIGGVNPDYTDFSEAILSLDQCGIGGPVTFNVASGTYNEQIEIPVVTGSSTTNTITFKSVSGDSSTVILNHGASSISDNYTLRINGTSNIKFQEMTIQASNSTFGKVMELMYGAHDIEIKNSVIKSMAVANVSDKTMALLSTVDSVGSNINIHHNLFVNGSYAINLESSINHASGWDINNNTIQGYHYSGIELLNALSANVANNIVYASSNSTISDHKGIFLESNIGSPVIIKNKLSAAATAKAYGIGLSDCALDLLNPGTIANNFIQTNAFNSAGCGVFIQNTSNCNLYYNSVYLTGSAASSGSLILLSNGTIPTSNINIYNNILTNNASGNIISTTGVDTSKFVNDYNVFYNFGGTKFADLNGTIISDLSAWKTETNKAVHSDVINPYFSSPVDLHTANNAVNGIGIPITGITDDIDGETRNTTSPDPGADEFTPSPYDLEIMELLSPVSDCGLNSNETVTIRIKNVGMVTALGNLTASYTYEGGITVTETITDSLQIGDTLDYSFTSTVNLDVTGFGSDSTFVFKAWIDLLQDPIQANDSVFSSIESSYMPPAPITSATTINYGDSITLTAQHIDSNMYWFAYDTSSIELYAGKLFTTPQLYDTTTYWTEVRGAVSGEFFISEVCHYKATTGAPPNGWPSYLVGDDYIEITGIPGSDLAGYTLEQWGTVTSNIVNSFTFLPGTVLSPQGTAIIAIGQGAAAQSPANYYYNGATSANWSSANPAGRIIKDPQGNIMDAVGINGYNFPAGANVLATDWSASATAGVGTCGFRLTGEDNNTGSNWIVTSALNPQDPNIINAGVVAPLGISCASDRVPLIVNVSGIPTVELGISSISIPSGCNLTSSEQIQIEIINRGLQAANGNIQVSYKIDATSYITPVTIADTIHPYDTLLYTFATLANLYAPVNDTSYAISAYVSHNLDTYIANDTIAAITFSNYSPSAPIVSDTVTSFATSLTLTTQSINPNTWWFASDTGMVPLALAASFTTPTLYDTTTYWVEYSEVGVACHSVRVPLTVNVLAQPPFDAGVTSILTPTSGINLTSSEIIQVMVHNTGADSIYNFPLAYMIDNLPAIVDTFTNVLHSGSSALFTFAVPADLSAIKTYDIIAYTLLPLDTVSINDTAFVQILNEMPTYCISSATSTSYLDIGNVNFAGINNASSSPFDKLYTDYTNTPPAQIKPSNTYPISIDITSSHSLAYGGFVEVYIDYNRDGIYTESTETVFGAFFSAASSTIPANVTGNVAIPFNAMAGLTQMRVVVRWNVLNSAGIHPCGTYNYGETEDYVCQIAPLISKDAGVIEIISLASVLNESASTPVEVVVKNFGIDTIFSMSIEYEINNGTPVSYTYNNTLLPANTDTVTLASFISPVGNSNICAYTILTGDTNNFNDSICQPFFGTPLKDAYVTKIVEIDDGCGLGSDTILIWIKNIGVDTINGPSTTNAITAHYQLNGISSTVQENMTLQINPGDSALFAFNTLANFMVSTVDSLFNIVAWVNLVGDNISNNDTTYSDVNSLYTPVDPIVTSPISISYATYATMSAISTSGDSLIWYDSLIGGTQLFNGSNYTTGLLYNTDTFYVQSISSGGCTSNRVPLIVNVSAPSTCDVGVYRLAEPISSIYMTALESVKVVVNNYGTIAQTNIPVSYQINGGVVVTDTILTTIPSNDSLVYTFNNPADLSISGSSYDFKLYTSLGCDAVKANDTIVRTIQNLTPNYCPSYAGNTAFLDIGNVTIGGINNTSLFPYNKTYTDFTNISPALASQGDTLPVSITLNSPTNVVSSGFVELYIDYNRDGIYTEPTETAFGLSFNGLSPSNPVTITGNVVIPVGAATGQTHMRVVAELSAADGTFVFPCGTYTSGETEDYSISIVPSIPKDAGIEAILTPVALGINQNPNLTVRIRNYGLDTIYSVDVEYDVNAAGVSTYTYNASPIPPSDSVDVLIANISLQQGINTICANTVLPFDSNAFNDGICAKSYIEVVVSAPFIDDFEGNNIWFDDTLANQWELGAPAGTVFNAAHSGVNVWATHLGTTYSPSNGSGDVLYSPNIEVSGIDSLILKFWHKADMDATTDMGLIEINSGSGFIPLGFYQDPLGTNWYDYVNGGNHGWHSTGNAWMQSEFRLNFSDQNNAYYQADTIQFRFKFKSNGSSSNEGWMIDDFRLEAPQFPINAAVVSIDTPSVSTPIGSIVHVNTSVVNFGTTSLSNIPIEYNMGNGWVSETWNNTSNPLAFGDTLQFTFTTPFTVPSSDYQICVRTVVVGDGFPGDDEQCKQVTASPPMFDASLAILSPTDSTFLNYDPPVSVRVYNNGTATLNTIPVSYIVNANTVYDTITTSIASGDSIDFTYTTTYQSVIGQYSLCAKTDLPNDANPVNDEDCIYLYGGVNGLNDMDPNSFVLNQNHPNPASNSFTITYEVTVPGEIHFELHNSLGQSVFVLKESAHTGLNTINLDASNLNNGVYFYSVEFNGIRKTLRMVVTK